MKFFIVLLLTAIVGLSSCNVGKVLDKPAYILIEKNSFSTYFDLMSEKYVDRQKSDEYISDFETKLEESLKTYNIELISSIDQFYEPGNVFMLELKRLDIDEKYETESVYMDSLSNYTETFDVVSCNVKAECYLFQVKSNGDKDNLRSIIVNADKDEKLSNSRSFWQVIFGSNKDNSDYTYKELDNDIIFTLCHRTARRVAGKSSRTIEKYQNK